MYTSILPSLHIISALFHSPMGFSRSFTNLSTTGNFGRGFPSGALYSDTSEPPKSTKSPALPEHNWHSTAFGHNSFVGSCRKRNMPLLLPSIGYFHSTCRRKFEYLFSVYMKPNGLPFICIRPFLTGGRPSPGPPVHCGRRRGGRQHHYPGRPGEGL